MRSLHSKIKNVFLLHKKENGCMDFGPLFTSVVANHNNFNPFWSAENIDIQYFCHAIAKVFAFKQQCIVSRCNT